MILHVGALSAVLCFSIKSSEWMIELILKKYTAHYYNYKPSTDMIVNKDEQKGAS